MFCCTLPGAPLALSQPLFTALLPLARHCAWCGDPPDEHGSHGICPEHAAEQRAKVQAARRERLLRERGQA